MCNTLQLYAIVGTACPKEQKARERLPTSKSTKGLWRGYSAPASRRACGVMNRWHPSKRVRKGSCLDNAATERVFGHLKDEFFRGGQ